MSSLEKQTPDEKKGGTLTPLPQALTEAAHQLDEAPEQNSFNQQREQRSGDSGCLQGVRVVVAPFHYYLQLQQTIVVHF